MTISSTSLFGIKGEDFNIRLEYNKDFIIIHLPYVDKFTKSTYLEMKTLLEDWNTFFKTVGYKETFVAFDPNNQKITKLVRLLNFSYIGNNEGLSIYKYTGG